MKIDTETQTVVLDNGKVRDIVMLQQKKTKYEHMWALISANINLQQVRYSHLILCTGTNGQFPGKHNSVDTYHSAIQKYEDFVKVVSCY